MRSSRSAPATTKVTSSIGAYFTGRCASLLNRRHVDISSRPRRTGEGFWHPLNTDVNWNNWLNKWYSAQPNEQIPNNPDPPGPDSAAGSFDWMVSGRSSAHTIWTEDWFGDQDAQTWSCYADALRSCVDAGQHKFRRLRGRPVVGGAPGGRFV